MALPPQTAALLKRYGLGALIPWASSAIVLNLSPEEFELQLYDQPAFIARFPAIKARENAGKSPLSVDEYLTYERTAQQLGAMWDIPLSKSEVDNLLIGDVSNVELEQRFTIAATAVYTTPAEDRQAMFDLYGITEGNLAKYWMDPKKEFGTLQQQYVASRIAGSAIRSGFGGISALQAERLYDVGVSPEQASQGFGELYLMRGLFEPIDTTEAEITKEQQLGLLSGEATTQESVAKRQAKRKAEFAGSGAFAAGGEGFQGVGTAVT